MKQASKILVVWVAALACLVVACTTANRVAFQTVGTTHIAVKEAMSQWNTYIGEKHPPVSQQIQVRDAYMKYQAAAESVCDAGAALATAANSTNTNALPKLQAAFDEAMANSANAVSDVENLMAIFGLQLTNSTSN